MGSTAQDQTAAPSAGAVATTPDAAVAAAPGALVGRQLGHFRIDRFLAAGGMGEIYQATDTSLNRPVAIKTLQPSLTRDPASLSAFLVEAQAQASVVHPHVLQVYFLGQAEDGLTFMAMQLVEGGSLHDLLDRDGKLPWQEAARHMLGLAEGLAEAARIGIVHRDVKPANALVDRYGEAHLGDFGLAVAGAGMLPPGRAAVLPEAQPRTVAGTPEYMAPEQARGEPLDQRADIYALGATFYQLLCGRTPVQPTASLVELVAAHQGGGPAPLHALRPDVPKSLARIVDRCLARDKAQRFATHAELVAALRRAQPQPVVPASPIVRALAWALEAAPIGWVSWMTYARWPWVAFAVYLAATVAGLAAGGSPPGDWLLRLRLRTAADGDVSVARGTARFLIQTGWLLPFVYFLHEAWRGSATAVPLGWLAIALAAPALLGTLGAVFGRRQALHDFLTGTRVLVDTR